MVYNAGQWNLIIVIYALGSAHEKFETKALHSRNSYVGHSIIIDGSIFLCTQLKALGWVHEKFDVWTGPKVALMCIIHRWENVRFLQTFSHKQKRMARFKVARKG